MSTDGTPTAPPGAHAGTALGPARSLEELARARDRQRDPPQEARAKDGDDGKAAHSGGGTSGGGADDGDPGGRRRRRVGGRRARGPEWLRRLGRGLARPPSLLVALASSLLTLGTIAVALAGLVTHYFVADMPSVAELRIPKRAPSITVMTDDGEIMGRRGTVHAGFVTYGEMPEHLVQAVVAIEDLRYFDHIGVDVQGLMRAAYENYKAGRVVQGGSTITQQLAKNLFLKPDRTIRRKIQEAILALRLEGAFTKHEILEMYLNRVYFGAGMYGVEAASERYFEKNARDLTLAESAMLAGLLKAPSRYAPTSNKDRAVDRAQVVLGNMAQAGFITEQERFVAEQVLRMPSARSETHEIAPFVLDWVAESLPDLIGEPTGDLVIETTIDPSLQEIAEEAAAKAIAENGEAKHVEQASVVLMANDGAIRAMVGGLDHEASQFNRAVKALRQPGSTFKVFVYATALEHGYSPWDQRYDQPIRIANWEPKNYGNTYRGPVTLHEALTLSINTVAAQIAAEIGPGAVVDMAHRLGIQSELEAVPSIALGTGEVTLLELTGAFTAFANGGEVAVPFVIKRVLSADGRVMFERQGSRGGQELGARETADMNMMLTSVMNAGTGTRARLAVHPAAGKTGTTQDYRDAWFIGYTGHYTAGVWVGNDDNSEMKRVTGGSIPASIWKEVMNKAHEGLDVISLEPSADLPPPPVDPYYNRQPSIGSFLSSLFGGRPSQPQPTYGYPDRYRDSYGRPLGPRYPGIAQGRQPAMPYQRLAPPRADQRSARPSSFGSFLGNVFGRRELKDDPRDY